MLTSHYYDFFVLLQRLVNPSNETNCTPETSETLTESSTSDTVDSLNPQRFNIGNSLLLRLVKGVDSTANADDRCESSDCPVDAFGCLEISPQRWWGIHRLVHVLEKGGVLANFAAREFKYNSIQLLPAAAIGARREVPKTSEREIVMHFDTEDRPNDIQTTGIMIRLDVEHRKEGMKGERQKVRRVRLIHRT